MKTVPPHIKCKELKIHRFYLIEDYQMGSPLAGTDSLEPNDRHVPWTKLALFLGEVGNEDYKFLVGDQIGYWYGTYIYAEEYR